MKNIPENTYYLGFRVRTPFPSECSWFAEHPEITGYASEDGCIVINPEAKLTSSQIECVCVNEAYRLLMHRWKIVPKISPTSKQRESFRGTSYFDNEDALKQTIIARILANDSSAGKITDEQRGYSSCLEQFSEVLAEINLKNR
jgi:hypothetical protein